MNMTIEVFNERVKNGQQLVILDDLVLDISRYQFSHPGGKFVLAHNIGRDISKFFYGGYSMESLQKHKPYTHSNIAKIIVNGIIVARLNSHSKIIKARIEDKETVNTTTSNFIFKVLK